MLLKTSLALAHEKTEEWSSRSQRSNQDVQKDRRTREAGTRAAASEEAETHCIPKSNGYPKLLSL
jgi:hypothetical protein